MDTLQSLLSIDRIFLCTNVLIDVLVFPHWIDGYRTSDGWKLRTVMVEHQMSSSLKFRSFTRRENVEQHSASTVNYITHRASKNNTDHDHYHYRRKKRTKNERFFPDTRSILPADVQIDSNEQERRGMKTPSAWTKKWTKWFSSCGSDRQKNPISNIVTDVSRCLFATYFQHLLCDWWIQWTSVSALVSNIETVQINNFLVEGRDQTPNEHSSRFRCGWKMIRSCLLDGDDEKRNKKRSVE